VPNFRSVGAAGFGNSESAPNTSPHMDAQPEEVLPSGVGRYPGVREKLLNQPHFTTS